MSIMNLFAVRVLENINCKEPDCTDPLNMDAAALLSKGKDEFRAYMIEHGLL